METQREHQEKNLNKIQQNRKKPENKTTYGKNNKTSKAKTTNILTDKKTGKAKPF
jgi:hypothetical protein